MEKRFYGVRTMERATEMPPAIMLSGITVAFGTAPAHMVGGAANEIVMAYDFDEAVSALGYSDDWKKYTLCEVMYNHFKLYGIAPLIMVNVLNYNKYKELVPADEYQIVNAAVPLSGDVIADTVVITSGENTYVAGEDYDIVYSDGLCIIEMLPGGAIVKAGLTSVTIEYSRVAYDAEDMIREIIGGYNTETGESTGMELLDKVYYKTKVLPDIVIAPGWSQHKEVAAVMAAKTTFSTVFRAVCICDIDAENTTKAIEAKTASASFQNPKQIVCWPKVALDDRIFYMSTQLAAQMGVVDAENDNVPSQVASNFKLKADSAVLQDGTEVLLDLDDANYLRGQGIVTALNFANGFTSWGAYTAAYPDNVDMKDMFINIARTFNYVSNDAVLTFWRKIDKKLTARYVESLVDQMNLKLKALTADGHLLGARIGFLAAENSKEDLMAGIIRLHIYLAVPAPAQEIDFIMEYDVSYVAALLESMIGASV